MRLPRYPKYNDSGVKWLGEVPEHWKRGRIKYALTEKPAKVGSTLPCGAISFGEVVFKDGESVREETIATYQEVLAGEFLINPINLNYDLKSLRTALSQIDVCVSSAYIVASTSLSDLSPGYIKYLLHLFDVAHMKTLGAGVRQTITFDDIGNCYWYLPTPDEQRQICEFLDREIATVDKLVQKMQRLNELLHEKRQAVISHAVTKGLNPDVPMKDSGIEWLGVVPANWAVTKLLRFAKDIGDGLHGTPEYVDDSTYYFINGNNLCDGAISISATTRSVSLEEFEKHKLHLDEASLLLSINGTIGNLGLYRGETVILGKSAAYINCSQGISRDFLFFFLQSVQVKSYFDLEVTGTTISNLSLESIRNLPIACPPVEEQRDIALVLRNLDVEFKRLVAGATNAIDLLQERRTTLISAAITGKIDVRGLASTEAA